MRMRRFYPERVYFKLRFHSNKLLCRRKSGFVPKRDSKRCSRRYLTRARKGLLMSKYRDWPEHYAPPSLDPVSDPTPEITNQSPGPSNDPPPGPSKPSSNRKVQVNLWKKLWPWVTLKDGKMHFTLCTEKGKNNTFRYIYFVNLSFIEMSHEKVLMSHYNKKCPIDIENYGAIDPSTLSSFLITVSDDNNKELTTMRGITLD